VRGRRREKKLPKLPLFFKKKKSTTSFLFRQKLPDQSITIQTTSTQKIRDGSNDVIEIFKIIFFFVLVCLVLKFGMLGGFCFVFLLLFNLSLIWSPSSLFLLSNKPKKEEETIRTNKSKSKNYQKKKKKIKIATKKKIKNKK
jgi:hypothetical protein